MQSANKAISGTTLKATLTQADWNNLSNQFRQGLDSKNKDIFQSLAPEQKHEWIGQWVLDPSAAIRKGFNKSTAFNVVQDEETETWVTELQLGGPKYLNCAEHAHVVVESGELLDA